jgi:ankyrin repeat protein
MEGEAEVGRMVQQPLRYVHTSSMQHFDTEKRILEAAIKAIDDSGGCIRTFRRVVENWEVRGLSPKRLDELSVAQSGLTLIAHACTNVSNGIAEFLLTLDLDFDNQDRFGRTALHHLSKAGIPGLVTTVIPKVKRKSSLDINGDCPLSLSIRQGNHSVTSLLIAAGTLAERIPQPSTEIPGVLPLPRTLLELAASRQDHQAVEALLGADADPNMSGEFVPLEAAILRGTSRSVELLLEAGAKIDMLEVDCLDCLKSAGAGEVSRVQISQAREKYYLLETFLRKGQLKRSKRTGPEFAQHTSAALAELLLAINMGDTATFEQSLNRWNNRNIRVGELRDFCEARIGELYGLNALMHAARVGAAGCLGFMLLCHPDLSLADSIGWTPLRYACKFGHCEVARILLEKSEQIDHCPGLGCTLLCLTAIYGHTDVGRLLIEAGANVDGKVLYNECSPLYWACTNNRTEMALLLLKKGADVNFSNRGQRPLARALKYGSVRTVTALLSAGASVNGVDRRTWIDLRWAYRKASANRDSTAAATMGEKTTYDVDDEVREPRGRSGVEWLDAVEKARLMVTKLKEQRQAHQPKV